MLALLLVVLLASGQCYDPSNYANNPFLNGAFDLKKPASPASGSVASHQIKYQQQPGFLDQHVNYPQQQASSQPATSIKTYYASNPFLNGAFDLKKPASPASVSVASQQIKYQQQPGFPQQHVYYPQQQQASYPQQQASSQPATSIKTNYASNPFLNGAFNQQKATQAAPTFSAITIGPVSPDKPQDGENKPIKDKDWSPYDVVTRPDPVKTKPAVEDLSPYKVVDLPDPVKTKPDVEDLSPYKVVGLPDPVKTKPDVEDWSPYKVVELPDPVKTKPVVEDLSPYKVVELPHPVKTKPDVEDWSPYKVVELPDPVKTKPMVEDWSPYKVVDLPKFLSSRSRQAQA
jgi:hypothetical protein